MSNRVVSVTGTAFRQPAEFLTPGVSMGTEVGRIVEAGMVAVLWDDDPQRLEWGAWWHDYDEVKEVTE